MSSPDDAALASVLTIGAPLILFFVSTLIAWALAAWWSRGQDIGTARYLLRALACWIFVVFVGSVISVGLIITWWCGLFGPHGCT